ncbi:TolC family protein [Desulfopila inferna]|uniref:TolC family protein n=1 Tax=Desulfopila inferna TaxID=468528 RepID=UPI0019635DD1|nr:TolC family protein [Desulfopila inferna]MBM9605581.1 TolC family protein [Desulfopila inferna]
MIFCGGLLAMVTAGCASVERLPIFADTMEQPVFEKADDPALIPTQLQIRGEPIMEKSESDIPQELAVEQAVMLALRHNSDLQVNQLSPVIAGTFELIERGVYDPELFAELRYFREKRDSDRGGTIVRRDDSTRETQFAAGVRQILPSGTTLEALVGRETTVFDEDDEEQEARAELSVTQSLLRGFGSSVNLVSIRQAEIDTMASIEELKGFINILLADTETAYWQYVLARKEIDIFEQSLEVARKQREEIELSIEVGFLPEFEAAAARAEEALRVQALINAESLLEDRRLRLLRLISPRLDNARNSRIIAITDPGVSPRPIDNTEDRLKLAEQIRPDLGEARLRLHRNRLETIMTRNGLLPRLELFMTLGKNGYGESFGDSFSDVVGDSYAFTAGLRLSHFLGNRAAEGANLAAFAQRRQAVEAIENLRQIVQLDVYLAINEVERLRRQIEASRATRIFQEQTLKAEEERFEVGSSTALLVAQAQRDLLRTQIAEVEAVVNYRIALVQLYLAEGSLIERRGVQVAETRSGIGL